MQVDMHYYGTYAMARAAGLRPDICKIIATAAQFVDDNGNNQTEVMRDGARVDIYATAHHATNVKNLNEQDQRHVWVPFHFLPGNIGDSYTERMICRMDGPVARQMVDHHLDLADMPFAVELLGITAHVYADTFSHYGFSGISSRWNRVEQSTIQLFGLGEEIEKYVRDKEKQFFREHGESGGIFRNIRSFILDSAEKLSGALGHGGVATYPDRPYLNGQFIYEYDKSQTPVRRDNHETFLKGCEALHRMFRQFTYERPDLTADSGRDFIAIRDRVSDILAVQASCNNRIKAWQDAVTAGDIYAGTDAIPIYDENEWHLQRGSFSTLNDSKEALKLPVFRFYQAAALHRTYILRDLLPKHDLVID